MAGSVNKVILVGNLGADPEIKSVGTNGNKVANLSLATSESWRDKNSGEKKERTEWHRIVIWTEGLVKVVEQYLHKGDKIYIEGQLQTRKWQDKDGNDRYSTEVVLQGFNANLTMLSTKGGGDDRGEDRGGRESSAPRQEARRPASNAPAFDDGGMDDDIPF